MDRALIQASSGVISVIPVLVHPGLQLPGGDGGGIPCCEGQTGRKLESSGSTTRHLSGRSVRVLAFGLAFLLKQAG